MEPFSFQTTSSYSVVVILHSLLLFLLKFRKWVSSLHRDNFKLPFGPTTWCTCTGCSVRQRRAAHRRCRPWCSIGQIQRRPVSARPGHNSRPRSSHLFERRIINFGKSYTYVAEDGMQRTGTGSWTHPVGYGAAAWRIPCGCTRSAGETRPARIPQLWACGAGATGAAVAKQTSAHAHA